MPQMEKQIVLEEEEIDILVDLIISRLLIMQDELKTEPVIKPILAYYWDLYMKLLKLSNWPGPISNKNPYK